MLGLGLNVIRTGHTALQLAVTISCRDQQTGGPVQGRADQNGTSKELSLASRHGCPCAELNVPVTVNCGDQQSGGPVQGLADPRGTSQGLSRAAREDPETATYLGGCMPTHEPTSAASGPQVSPTRAAGA